MTRFNLYTVFCSIVLFGSCVCYAQEVPFGVSVFQDSSNKLCVEQIQKQEPQFQTIQSHAPNMGNSTATLWVKVKLPKHERPIIITVENSHIDQLSCYIKEEGKDTYRKFHTGDHTVFATRDINSNLFSFTVYPRESIVYFQAKTEGLLSVPLRAHTLYQYFEYDRSNQMVLWFFYGIACIALIANLIFYAALKDKVYLYYSLYVFANLIYSSVDVETTFQYLWPQWPHLNKYNVLFYSSFVFILLFCIHFLGVKKHSKLHHLLYQIFIGIIVILGFLSLFDYRIAIQWFTYALLVMPVFIIISGITIYRNSKDRIYLLFLGGWGIYLIGILIYIAAVMGFWEYNGSYSLIIPLASAFEMSVMFVTVLYRVNQLREDGIRAKNQVIELLQGQEQLLHEQNTLLEEKVRERTQKLQELNDDIMSQNEEIMTQNEELYQQRQVLEQQGLLLEEKSKIINMANRELSEYKTHLEQLVEERTSELKKSNDELELKNKQMEQFSFMAAHNLRSPIASLLGLASLASENIGNEQLEKEIVKRIELSVKKLDIVVRTLNNMLSDLNTIEKLIVPVFFDPLLDEMKSLLQKEISDSNAQIILETNGCERFDTIRAYMHNLFYNLISNSLKYRRPDCAPLIHITIHQLTTGVELIFQDNGQGIDLEKYGSELFKAFKRFNDTVEGIGVGLYLVKTQIHSLGGKITVASKVNEGTNFTVFIPNYKAIFSNKSLK